MKMYAASAFCMGVEGGNKAGVVIGGDHLTDEKKKKIAADLAYSETVFISSSDRADMNMGYFTPTEEVPLCGHATLAAFGVLYHLKKISTERYTIETKSGILEVRIEDGEIFMEQNLPAFYEEIPAETVRGCFNTDCIDESIPIRIVSTGLRDILIPVKNRELLDIIRPDLDFIRKLSIDFNAVGIHAYAFDGERIICRNFAPLYGIDEESATGTSNCALAGFLYEKLKIKKTSFTMEQGYNLGLPSVIRVRLETKDDGSIDRIFVGGKCKFLSEIQKLQAENGSEQR